MADNRYKNNIHINRHQPLAINLSNPNHPLNHGWEFAYHSKRFNQTVYAQEGMKLMFYMNNKWIVLFPFESASVYQGTMKEITEDALKELVE